MNSPATMAIFKVLVAWLGGLMAGGALEAFPDATVGHVVQLVVGLALLAWACPFVTDLE